MIKTSVIQIYGSACCHTVICHAHLGVTEARCPLVDPHSIFNQSMIKGTCNTVNHFFIRDSRCNDPDINPPLCSKTQRIQCLKSFRINKTLKLYCFSLTCHSCLKSFRINKTLKPSVNVKAVRCSLKSFRINKTLKPEFLVSDTIARLKSFRINKTLKRMWKNAGARAGLKSFRINKTLKPVRTCFLTWL